MIEQKDALPGRDMPDFEVPNQHAVLGTSMKPPFPEGMETAVFALGCFWGPEREFWNVDGVYTTATGYAGGYTPNPTYREVCTGKTGHAEAVLVVFDPDKITYQELLKKFWESHDPTQEMRQGNDIGSQYRSAILYTDEDQRKAAEETLDVYQKALKQAGHKKEIATEIKPAEAFYYAEGEHQQYLHKVPNGYCDMGGTGVGCPIGLGVQSDAASDDLPATEEEWRERLTSEQYTVLRQAGTERPFTGEYVDTEDSGVYKCAACGNMLFNSETKYHSGCGWPSFTGTASDGAVEYRKDSSFGMTRTEVLCARCHSHLGHVFDDGPVEAGGQRYCMNSVALNLEKV